MSRIPQGKAREIAPEGVFPAICVQVIDLGTQPSGNPQYKDSRRVQLAFELVGETTEEGDPFVVYKNYTYSNHPKSALMKDLKGWLQVKSGDYDMDNVLGKPASVTIEHKETDKGTYANITSVAGVTKGTKVAKPREALKSLYLDDTFDKETFDALPEFLRTKIAGSPEYAEAVGPKMKKEKAAPAKATKAEPATKAPAKKGKK